MGGVTTTSVRPSWMDASYVCLEVNSDGSCRRWGQAPVPITNDGVDEAPVVTPPSADKAVIPAQPPKDQQVIPLVAAPIAEFEYSLFTGLAVVFSNTSIGESDSVFWDFGDGSTSTSANPSHTFSSPGSYTVQLAVTNAGGTDTYSEVIGVAENGTMEIQFSYTIDGLDLTITDAPEFGTNYYWTFGDGNNSSERLPNYTYAGSGTYTVTLQVDGIHEVDKEITTGSAYWFDTFTGEENLEGHIIDSAAVSWAKPSDAPALQPQVTGGEVVYLNGIGKESCVYLSIGFTSLQETSTDYRTMRFEITEINCASSEAFVVHVNAKTSMTFYFHSTGDGSRVWIKFDSSGWNCRMGAEGVDRLSGSGGVGVWDITITGNGGVGLGFNFEIFKNGISQGNWDTTAIAVYSNASFTFMNVDKPALGADYTFDPGGGRITWAGCSNVNEGFGGGSGNSDLQNQEQAMFSFTIGGLGVLFLDESTGEGTSWLWDFGDSNSSTEQNPFHVYDSAGTYTVELTLNGTYTYSVEITVSGSSANYPVPIASFTIDDSSVLVGDTVTFADISTGNTPTAWAWEFGDGDTSASQNPTHVYDTAGVYTVRLKVSNSFGASLVVAEGTVVVTEITTVALSSTPVASFSMDADNGMAALTVSFTDTSIGDNINEWLWNFGDDSTSTLQNPTHNYYQRGTYIVTLTVEGVAVITRPIVIYGYEIDGEQGTPPVSPSLGDSYLITTGTGAWLGQDDSIAIWDGAAWVFDAPTDTDFVEPPILLNGSGQYGTWDTGGWSFDSTVPDINLQPRAMVSADTYFGIAGLVVNFTSAVSGSVEDYLWKIGGSRLGLASTLQHTFSEAGAYTIELDVANAYGTTTTTILVLIFSNKWAKSSDNYYYILDTVNNRVVVFDKTNDEFQKFVGSAGDGDDEFNNPTSIEVVI